MFVFLKRFTLDPTRRQGGGWIAFRNFAAGFIVDRLDYGSVLRTTHHRSTVKGALVAMESSLRGKDSKKCEQKIAAIVGEGISLRTDVSLK